VLSYKNVRAILILFVASELTVIFVNLRSLLNQQTRPVDLI
jgi:hypothetical protein